MNATPTTNTPADVASALDLMAHFAQGGLLTNAGHRALARQLLREAGNAEPFSRRGRELVVAKATVAHAHTGLARAQTDYVVATVVATVALLHIGRLLHRQWVDARARRKVQAEALDWPPSKPVATGSIAARLGQAEAERLDLEASVADLADEVRATGVGVFALRDAAEAEGPCPGWDTPATVDGWRLRVVDRAAEALTVQHGEEYCARHLPAANQVDASAGTPT